MARQTPIDPETRKTALLVLGRGEVTLPEMARLLGVSTHVVWNWCRIAGIDWKRVRGSRLTTMWRKELHRGRRLGKGEAQTADKNGGKGRVRHSRRDRGRFFGRLPG